VGREHSHQRFSPVELIPCGQGITEVIESFARSKILDCDTYYRNLPVWILREPVPKDNRIRRVQVTAYLVSTRPYLSLVSSFNELSEHHKVLVPRRAPTKRLALEELFARRKLDPQKLLMVLEEAWESTADCIDSPGEMVAVPMLAPTPAPPCPETLTP
jgi:hypothetical protein